MTIGKTRAEKSKRLNLRKVLKVRNSGLSKIYFLKSIEYGTYLDVYEYNKVKITFQSRRDDYDKKEKGEKRPFSLSRARQNVYRIAEANVNRHGNETPIFFTFTFAAHITNLSDAHSSFKKVIRKLSKYLNRRVQYIVVPEFQKRGVVHYHGIFYNVPFISINDWRERFWTYGFIDLQIPQHKILNIASYIAKYITKEMADTRLFNRKTYFCSRGMLRPVENYDDYVIDRVRNSAIMEQVDYSTGYHYSLTKYKKHEP